MRAAYIDDVRDPQYTSDGDEYTAAEESRQRYLGGHGQRRLEKHRHRKPNNVEIRDDVACQERPQDGRGGDRVAEGCMCTRACQLFVRIFRV